ncbi:uncharacterized protein Tco025E_07036 [Trypanosoma conorhini]|uniref:Uncharacterized protein n=1 Tax=Trypanosoma conorhini TaxID=83891 RepID=A0A422NUK3_9TRYP|nr:uncharacterized protein Tco025E_07036 [Trypanosoma conorhini]RNF09153.1 hypothetical protein Tco025E_07036 [Trypanosoma conorhini]
MASSVGGRRAAGAERPQAQPPQHTLRLVEKLLDLHVRDALAVAFAELRRREREAAFTNSLPAPGPGPRGGGEATQKYTVGRARAGRDGAGAAAAALEEAIRAGLRDECRVDAASAAERWFTAPHDSGFVFILLRRLASMTEAEARQEIRDAVARYVDPHVKAFWDMKRLQRAADGYGSDGDGDGG